MASKPPWDSKHRASYSQNFIKNPALARYVVSLAQFPAGEQILEIGPGLGILTEVLLETKLSVKAVEKDPELYSSLLEKFKLYLRQKNKSFETDQPATVLELIQGDFLDYNWVETDYSVFANPPFSIASAIVKKLIFRPNRPKKIYLFVQRELADRLMGRHFQTVQSVATKLFYNLEVIHQFTPTDFSPKPNVDVVLLEFKLLLVEPWLAENQQLCIKFITFAFQAQKSSLQKALEPIFSYRQWKQISRDCGFDLKSRAPEIPMMAWKKLLQAFLSPLVSEEKRRIVIETII